MQTLELSWPVQALEQSLAAVWPDVQVEVLPELDSSNSALLERARTGWVLPALLVAERQTVVDAAKAVKADLKVDGMSNADIKKAIVRDALTNTVVDAKLAGKSEDYVDAFYDANFDNLKRYNDSTQTLADGVANLKNHNFGDTSKQEEEAFEKSKSRFDRKKK